MNLNTLVELSRFYGNDPAFILAGGGNTSQKAGGYLYVKASGYKLGEIDSSGFVKLPLAELLRIFEKEYPADVQLREQQSLADLMAARMPGEAKRPSVESLLHAILPQPLVVHTHPALVNGLTCSRLGRERALEFFGSRCLWIPAMDPGYTLACEVKAQLKTHQAEHKVVPEIIFLANHGVFVGGDTGPAVKAIYEELISTLKVHAPQEPDFTPQTRSPEQVEAAQAALLAIPELAGMQSLFACNREIERFTADHQAFSAIRSAFTPDHIVYAGPEFLYCCQPEELSANLQAYTRRHHCLPRIIVFRGLGVFALAPTHVKARTALDLFLDALKIALYAASFGGGCFMSPEQIDFIVNWEVERFRLQVSLE